MAVYRGIPLLLVFLSLHTRTQEAPIKDMYCPALPDPPNGRVIQPNLFYGANVTIDCDEGYFYTKPEYITRHCLANGSWSGEAGPCNVATCPRLPDVLHGHVFQPNRSYLANATIYCDQGYTYSMPNATIRVCKADGTWSGEPGICEVVVCPELSHPSNGKIVLKSRTYMAIAVISCRAELYYTEANTRQCMQDGTWSGKQGKCQVRWWMVCSGISIVAMVIGVALYSTNECSCGTPCDNKCCLVKCWDSSYRIFRTEGSSTYCRCYCGGDGCCAYHCFENCCGYDFCEEGCCRFYCCDEGCCNVNCCKDGFFKLYCCQPDNDPCCQIHFLQCGYVKHIRYCCKDNRCGWFQSLAYCCAWKRTRHTDDNDRVYFLSLYEDGNDQVRTRQPTVRFSPTTSGTNHPLGSSEDVHLAADSMIETAIDGEDSLEKQIHRIIEAYLQGANSEPGDKKIFKVNHSLRKPAGPVEIVCSFDGVPSEDITQPLAGFIQENQKLEKIKYVTKGSKHYLEVTKRGSVRGKTKPDYFCVKTIWEEMKVEEITQEELITLGIGKFRRSRYRASPAKLNEHFSEEDSIGVGPGGRLQRHQSPLGIDPRHLSNLIHNSESSPAVKTVESGYSTGGAMDQEMQFYGSPKMESLLLPSGQPVLIRYLKQKGKTNAVLSLKRGTFSDDEVAQLRDAFDSRTCLAVLEIHDSMQPGCLQAFLNLLKILSHPKEIRYSITGKFACLEVNRNDRDSPAFYFLGSEEGTSIFLPAKRYLRQELASSLKGHFIPSAVDIKDDKLVFFLTDDEDVKWTIIKEEMRQMHGIFQKICKRGHLTGELNVCDEGEQGKCLPGCHIQFEQTNDKVFYATAGAFLRDEDDTLFILSSCHGENIQHCYFLDSEGSQKYECKYIAGAYDKKNIIDACLLEVDNVHLKNKLDYCLPIENRRIALYGPFVDSIEDIVDTPGKRVKVMKYGAKTRLTEGKLSYYDFEDPSTGISGGLIITPTTGKEAFTEEGDCGSVIFRQTPNEENAKSSDGFTRHEALAMHSSALTGIGVGTCSLASRLDTVIAHFENIIDKELHLLPTNVN